MDNSKIITVDKGIDINIYGKKGTYKTSHKQNFIIVAETETHFFYNDEKGNKISVWKNKINKVTFKNRTLKFKDLKKEEILNVIDNYRKIVILAQKMSKIISKYQLDQYDMSIYDSEDIRTGLTRTHFILINEHLTDGKMKEYSCKIPKKFLWDHSWRKNLKNKLENKK